MTISSIVQGLQQRSTSLFDNHHSSSLMYVPCWKCLNHGWTPFNAWFSILNSEKKLQTCGNASSSWLNVAILTHPHPEKHCIIAWWLMHSPPCGPSAMKHINGLLIPLIICHRNHYCIIPNILWIVETTKILIVIDIVCEVSKSLETPSNVILKLPIWHCTPLSQVIKGLDLWLHVLHHSPDRRYV